MTELQNENELAAALKIAGLVYGGVKEGTPQWDVCVRAVQAIAGTVPFQGVDKSFLGQTGKEAFVACADFNKKYPTTSKGTIHTIDGRTVPVTVDMTAMVFPDPMNGQSVMAFFSNVGWAETWRFYPDTKTQTPADELAQLSLQAKQIGKNKMAILLCRAALEDDPKCWIALNELGVHESANSNFEDAVNYYTRALVENPHSGEILNNRGMSLRNVGRAEEAVRDCMEALRLLPGHDLIALNAASALDDVGRVDECLDIINAFISRNPENPNIHYNKALLLLSDARLKEGWPEYRWRLMQPAVSTHYEHFDIPKWEGDSIAGKRVLIWAEQGIGDEIVMASMIGDVIAQASHVAVLCTDRLVPIFRRSFPDATIGARPAAPIVETFPRVRLRPEMLPDEIKGMEFDVQMNQGDLGQLFRPDLLSFPDRPSFLKVPIGKALDFENRCHELAGEKRRLVGISWHSGGNSRIGALKSLDIKQLIPILKTPGCTFVNLQYGDCTRDIEMIEREIGVKIINLPDIDPLIELDNYASLVCAMHAIVSVSNTTVHIAGALGVPTLVLTPTGPGKLWYFFRNTTSCPWYKSVVLIRQESALHWDSAIARAGIALAEHFEC